MNATIQSALNAIETPPHRKGDVRLDCYHGTGSSWYVIYGKLTCLVTGTVLCDGLIHKCLMYETTHKITVVNAKEAHEWVKANCAIFEKE